MKKLHRDVATALYIVAVEHLGHLDTIQHLVGALADVYQDYDPAFDRNKFMNIALPPDPWPSYYR